MTAILKSLAKIALSPLRVRPGLTSRNLPKILPSDVPIEEELFPYYNFKYFCPIHPGDRFHDRYETLTKLGWGSSSTVWLARDLRRWRWQRNRYIVLKVNNCNFADKEGANHELDLSRHLATGNPSHEGFSYVRNIIDSFEVTRPSGTHVCLVFEPMREPIWLFQQRLKNRRFPLPLLKGYLGLLLQGLDYIHSEGHIIHTDLKPENILVGFEEPTVIEDYVRAQAENPMPRKFKDGRSIYLSHNEFGPLRSYYILPTITDFGAAQRGDSAGPKIHPIQPDHYRAPEVILGTGWSYSVDIWSLGVLIWNLMEKRDLFQHIHSSSGKYTAQAHLAEMIALLGPPPKELLIREKEWRKWRWGPALTNAAGELCERALEFYGGPFFNDEGEFMQQELIPANVNLADSVTALEGEDKRLFLKFVSKMLQWLPEDRSTAKELLEDPWLVVPTE